MSRTGEAVRLISGTRGFFGRSQGLKSATLELIRKLSIALGVTTDMLIFGKDERGPDDDLRLQFEAISRFEPDEKRMIREIRVSARIV